MLIVVDVLERVQATICRFQHLGGMLIRAALGAQARWLRKKTAYLYRASRQALMPAGAVFLSYASEDAVTAERIAGALRAGSIEVWFDKSELRGGDASQPCRESDQRRASTPDGSSPHPALRCGPR
jgi:TIR domain